MRESFFRGEDFLGLSDAQHRAQKWCTTEAGLRIHGTTQRRPAEVFKAEELPTLGPAPQSAYDLPLWCEPKVHRDHHIEVQRALYSVPGDLIGRRVKARADAQLVKVFYQGKVVKVHPRKGRGGHSTDPSDLPPEKSVYALRDINRLKQIASSHGPHVGTYATRLLDIELPWTKMHGLPAAGAGASLLGRAGRRRLRQGLGARRRRCQPDRAHARAGAGIPAGRGA